MSRGRHAAARWRARMMLAGVLAVAACVPRPAGPRVIGREGAMHIEFERTGGVAGIRLATTVDTEALAADQAVRVQQLVEQSRFFELPTRLREPAPGADRFQYRITVRTADRSHTVDVAEGATPPSLRPLVDWLSAAARTPR